MYILFYDDDIYDFIYNIINVVIKIININIVILWMESKFYGIQKIRLIRMNCRMFIFSVKETNEALQLEMKLNKK